MRRWVGRIVVLLVLVAVVVALRLTVFQDDPVPVTVYRVARGRVDETVTNSKAGTVRTRRRASLGPEIGGRVVALPAREGDRVREGQVILRLADEDWAAQASLRERSLEAGKAAETATRLSAEQAQRDLERLERLARDEIISEDQLDQTASRRDVTAARFQEAAARVLEAAAALDVARVNLDRTVLRAPFDGILAELDVEVGEWITPSPPGVPIPPVLDILDPDAIYVSAPLDEVDVGRVQVGLPVRVTMDSHPGRSFPGTVVRVAPYVVDREEQNRTFEVEVELSDPEFAGTLLPGTSADVEVILDSREDVLRVPSYALIENRQVLVVQGETLVAVDVTTGLRNWGFTEIASGLSPGDQVVVSLDRAEVQAGVQVRIEGEPAG